MVADKYFSCLFICLCFFYCLKIIMFHFSTRDIFKYANEKGNLNNGNAQKNYILTYTYIYHVIVYSAISVILHLALYIFWTLYEISTTFVHLFLANFFRFILWNICIDALICLVLFSFICVYSCVQKYIYSRYKTVLFRFCTDNMYLVEFSLCVVEQVRRRRHT